MKNILSNSFSEQVSNEMSTNGLTFSEAFVQIKNSITNPVQPEPTPTEPTPTEPTPTEPTPTEPTPTEPTPTEPTPTEPPMYVALVLESAVANQAYVNDTLVNMNSPISVEVGKYVFIDAIHIDGYTFKGFYENGILLSSNYNIHFPISSIDTRLIELRYEKYEESITPTEPTPTDPTPIGPTPIGPTPTEPTPTEPTPTTPLDLNVLTQGTGTIDGFSYVDLDLPSGTMWATCNVGATKANEYGELFQYGCPDNNHYYTSSECFASTGISYCPPTTSRTNYSGEDLNVEDDMAYNNMGDNGRFRMPTVVQIGELIENTSYKRITIDGITGVLFTSKVSSDHRMFIPYGGYYDGVHDRFNEIKDRDTYLYLWSSTSYTDKTVANCLEVYNNIINGDYCNIGNSLITKINACSVRGVCKLS